MASTRTPRATTVKSVRIPTMAVLTRLRRLLVPSAPTTSVEIAADRVTGLTIGRGSGRAVLGVETEGLPDGANLYDF